MVDLPYSLVIEATEEPDYFGFFSPELEGFSGIGHSVEDCLYQARWAMKDHLALLAERQLPIPAPTPDPIITIRNQEANNRTQLIAHPMVSWYVGWDSWTFAFIMVRPHQCGQRMPADCDALLEYRLHLLPGIHHRRAARMSASPVATGAGRTNALPGPCGAG